MNFKTPSFSHQQTSLQIYQEMFARRFAQVGSRTLGGVRRMSDHHHEVPKDGLDGLIRKFLPKDQHVSSNELI